MTDGHLVVSHHFAQGLYGRIAPLFNSLFPDLLLTLMGISKCQDFTLFKGDFIPCQRIQQGGGKIRQLQAALNVARVIAHQCADLRGRFTFLLKGTKTDNLLGGMHVFTSTVLDHRGRHSHLHGQDFHRNKRRVCIEHTAHHQNACASAATFPADNADRTVRQFCTDQVLQDAHCLNAVCHLFHFLIGMRNDARV